MATRQKLNWRIIRTVTYVAVCYTHYLYRTSEGEDIGDFRRKGREFVGAFVLQPEKMDATRWTTRQKWLVQECLKKEEAALAVTGGLGVNCRRTVWVGKEPEWEVVGREGEVLGVEGGLGKKEEGGVKMAVTVDAAKNGNLKAVKKVVAVESVKKTDLEVGEVGKKIGVIDGVKKDDLKEGEGVTAGDDAAGNAAREDGNEKS